MRITGPGDLAEWLQVAQSIVGIIGLPILTLTLLMIWRQAPYAHHTAMSLRDSGILLHAVHNLTIHRRYMREYPWYVWERSLRDIYNKSPILQRFLLEHPDWYTDGVHRILTGGSPTPGARTTS